MHRALRPDGVLLDIHPEPELALVEVRGPAGVEAIGPLQEPTRAERVIQARRVLGDLLAAGYFTRRQAEVFTFLYHFDSAEAWRAYLAERWQSAEVGSDDEARVAAGLARTGGEVLIRERVHAAAYTRAVPR